jgi:pilus assembly protein CpaD
MNKTAFRTAIALSLGMALAGCGGMPTNRSLESIHQPVVERNDFTLDLATGPGGLPYPEQRRLATWFDSLNLHFGDTLIVDDPLQDGNTRVMIQEIASRYGVAVSSEGPITEGYVNAGTTRVIVRRSVARVPGCPDWSGKSDSNLNNATSSNYGCAVNSNLAAMVANPEHLVKGAQGDGTTVVMSASKAIDAYREAPTTGRQGLKEQSTSGK